MERLGEGAVERDKLKIILVENIDGEHLPGSKTRQKAMAEDAEGSEDLLRHQTKF